MTKVKITITRCSCFECNEDDESKILRNSDEDYPGCIKRYIERKITAEHILSGGYKVRVKYRGETRTFKVFTSEIEQAVLEDLEPDTFLLGLQ